MIVMLLIFSLTFTEIIVRWDPLGEEKNFVLLTNNPVTDW